MKWICAFFHFKESLPPCFFSQVICLAIWKLRQYEIQWLFCVILFWNLNSVCSGISHRENSFFTVGVLFKFYTVSFWGFLGSKFKIIGNICFNFSSLPSCPKVDVHTRQNFSCFFHIPYSYRVPLYLVLSLIFILNI